VTPDRPATVAKHIVSVVRGTSWNYPHRCTLRPRGYGALRPWGTIPRLRACTRQGLPVAMAGIPVAARPAYGNVRAVFQICSTPASNRSTVRPLGGRETKTSPPPHSARQPGSSRALSCSRERCSGPTRVGDDLRRRASTGQGLVWLTPTQQLMWASSAPAWHGIARADVFMTRMVPWFAR